ncbi:hypothetical protein MCGE09_00037 [Thaumarchaeota archaeon SCGC AB-539-E09]|nr:hypothetical protein MCGE09_00037 [Thaumarchaeota archaeon SCGC AB-539-E09]
MDETVKIELELPKNVHEAATKVSERFNYDLNTLYTRAIQGDLEASADGGFEWYYPVKMVPIHVDAKTAAYLKWWFKVARRTGYYDDIGEFLMTCARKYIEPRLENLLDQEKEELDKLLEGLGTYEAERFTDEIKELLQ